MRFAAPILEKFTCPEEWLDILRRRGYTAAYSPIQGDESDAEIDSYAKAAENAGIVIAEVGAWNCNPLSRDENERKSALEIFKKKLAAADRLNARCCVGLSGSRADKWDAPHGDNFNDDTFALVVDNIREIIDAVKPKRTFLTLEPMPWTFPFDVESHERLIKAVERTAYAVHYDPVNMVYSPDRYYRSGFYITDFIKRLGAHIRVVHCKDIYLTSEFVFKLYERIPGDGELDYTALLRGLETLDKDLPIVTEHLTNQQDYDRAETFIRNKAEQLQISL